MVNDIWIFWDKQNKAYEFATFEEAMAYKHEHSGDYSQVTLKWRA